MDGEIKKTPMGCEVSCCIERVTRERKKERRKEKEKKKDLGGGEERGKKKEKSRWPRLRNARFGSGLRSYTICRRRDKSVKRTCNILLPLGG
jgi:hypothetical protein